MNSTEFKHFTELLVNDRETTEHQVFLFMNLTEKQVIKTIQLYDRRGWLNKINRYGKDYYKFGLMTFPVDEYERITNK